jgi:hypothetical protein
MTRLTRCATWSALTDLADHIAAALDSDSDSRGVSGATFPLSGLKNKLGM